MSNKEDELSVFRTVRTEIANGQFTPERLSEIGSKPLDSGTFTVSDYISMAIGFDNLKLIDGVYRFMEGTGIRSGEEITRKVLELRTRRQELVEEDRDASFQNAAEIEKIDIQLQTIEWFVGRLKN